MQETRPRLPEYFKDYIHELKGLTEHELMAMLKQVKKTEFEKWIILPDVHRPFHNKYLWDAVLQVIADTKIDGIILSGDYLDLYSLGSYNADSLGLLTSINYDYDDELRDGRNGLAELYKVLPKDCKKVFIYGNHEDRYFREVNKKDNKKYGSALKSPTVGLELKENNWTILESWSEDSYSLTPDLEIAHGFFTNIHAAHKHMTEYDSSVIFGHTHRFQCYGSGTKIGYNIGWLGDKDHKVFKYMYKKARLKKWMNGFCFVNIDSNRHFWIEPVQCFEDRFFYNGKFYGKTGKLIYD